MGWFSVLQRIIKQTQLLKLTVWFLIILNQSSKKKLINVHGVAFYVKEKEPSGEGRVNRD